jgi:hypothetical protein
MIRSRHELSFSFFCLRGSIASPTQCTVKPTVCLGFVRTIAVVRPNRTDVFKKDAAQWVRLGWGCKLKPAHPGCATWREEATT